MRNFWNKRGDSRDKAPKEFFIVLEKMFLDTLEKIKALKGLVTLYHD